jgi:threonine dehydratase
VAAVDWVAAVRAAAGRIAPHALRTPLLHSPSLSAAAGCEIHLKLENLQHTGSFKLRGALNKVLSLSESDRARGVVTGSTGNHGAAVAFALRTIGVRGTVYVPEGAEPSKVARIESLGGRVEYRGIDSAETEAYAREVAARDGLTFISPYNDRMIAAGQGTTGLELAEQLADLDAAVVAVGGGGLISGVAGYLKAVHPGIEIVGCSPRNSAVMAESVRQGKVVALESLPTLSDGTAGGIERDAATFEWCRDLVDEFHLVDEPAIAAAMRRALFDDHVLIEGSAGVAVATALELGTRWPGGRIAVIICGGNVGPKTLLAVLTPSS